MTPTRDAVLAALAGVPDPEIPACSIVDLGIVAGIEIDDDAVRVSLLPTFAGCPALEAIQADATRAVAEVAAGRRVEVAFGFDEPWTTDRITPRGREAMRGLGIAPPQGAPASAPGGHTPPGRALLPVVLDPSANAGECPYCGAEDTELSSAFGPTPCRAIAYCRACRNPFEAFKPKRRTAPPGRGSSSL